MSIKEDYKHQINHTLAGFQILEYSILEYLNLYYLVVSTLLPPELTFNFNVADIKNPSLGNLIPYLSNSLSDESLINDIKSIRKRRNELAHQSFMNLYDGTCSDA